MYRKKDVKLKEENYLKDCLGYGVSLKLMVRRYLEELNL